MSEVAPATLPWMEGEEGWTLLRSPFWMSEHRQFLSGDGDPDRVQIRYYRRDRDQALMARVWVGPHAEGPPGHVHGGCLAAILDECMGLSAWITSRPCLAGRITVEFRRPVPLECAYTVEAFVEGEDGRKLSTRARFIDAAGQDLAVSEGTFIRMSLDRLAELAPGRGDWSDQSSD